MARISPYAFFQEFDNNGAVLAGGKVYTYDAGTTTPKATYTDSTEATANANPVILDASGRGDIWLGSGSYKFILRDSSDNLIKEVDDIAGTSVGGIVSYDITTTTAITEQYNNARINASGTLSLTLLSAVDAEDGFEFNVYNLGTGIVTIDPDGSETINNAATLALYPGASAIVTSDGDEWTALVTVNIPGQTSADIASGDSILFTDADDNNALKTDTIAGIFEAFYPVGSIYVNATNATNPGTLLGFGTWAAFGDGRVMVGLDSGDTDFDTAEETGGAKTHALSEAEMPAHTHTIDADNNNGSTADIVRRGNSAIGTVTTSSTGSGTAHNNLQPYIVVYMWKRTA